MTVMVDGPDFPPLAPLIEQARRERKWLFCSYQELWFSPDELAAQNRAGSFRWGPVNWQLRDPAERLTELAAQIGSAVAAYERFAGRVQARH